MTQKVSRLADKREVDENGSRTAVLIGAVIGLVVALAIFIGLYFVDPAPPRTVTIATGTEGGFYDTLGKIYKQRLERSGLTVNLVPSAGSIENLDLLRNAEADLAFVQGGVLSEPQPDMLMSLASIALEPFWIFSKTSEPVTRLEQLGGLRVAIGPEGSGTRRLSLTLFRAVGLSTIQIDERSGEAAADALMAGEVDAALFVTSARTGSVRRLLGDPNISLAVLERAEGLSLNFPYLSVVTVPEGAFNLEANRPRDAIRLIAPATTLLAHQDVHPAIVALVLDVVNSVHRNERSFGEVGRFPAPDFLELPLSEEAERYFERGPTFLRRYMPFWASNLVERLWVLVIPLITVLIPLMRVAPPAYRWQIRRRIYRWYDDLRELEAMGRDAENGETRREIIEDLETLASEVGTIRVPLAYTDDLYHLRLHIEFVIRLLNGTAIPGEAPPEKPVEAL